MPSLRRGTAGHGTHSIRSADAFAGCEKFGWRGELAHLQTPVGNSTTSVSLAACQLHWWHGSSTHNQHGILIIVSETLFHQIIRTSSPVLTGSPECPLRKADKERCMHGRKTMQYHALL